jgi:hypothetical protein
MMDRLHKTRHSLLQICYIYYKNTVKRGSADQQMLIGLLEKKKLLKNCLSLQKKMKSCFKKCKKHSTMLAKIQSVFILNVKTNK